MQNYSKIDVPEVVDSLFNVHSEQAYDCPDYAEDIEFTMADNTRLICRLFLANENVPTLLYFHDSRCSTEKSELIAKNYLDSGINFLLASYRGQGRNGGKPGISAMMEDANYILQETILLLQRRNFKSPLFVMGKSLGCACAIDVVYNSAESLKGMILESGFCDTIPFLNALGADLTRLGVTEDDGFNNREKIVNIKLPTLIFHGSRDTLVTPAQAETLQASSGARNKQFHIIPGADRETMVETGGTLYFQTIKTFIDGVCGVNTWRQRRKKFLEK